MPNRSEQFDLNEIRSWKYPVLDEVRRGVEARLEARQQPDNRRPSAKPKATPVWSVVGAQLHYTPQHGTSFHCSTLRSNPDAVGIEEVSRLAPYATLWALRSSGCTDPTIRMAVGLRAIAFARDYMSDGNILVFQEHDCFDDWAADVASWATALNPSLETTS